MTRKVRVRDVARTFAGGTPDRSNPTFFGGSIPWVKSAEVANLRITSTEEQLTEAGLAASSAKWCEKGSTLVAMYGANAGQVGRLGIGATTNQAVLCVQATDPKDSGFLFHAVSAAAPTLLGSVQGSGQPNLNAGIIRKLVLPWPPEPIRAATASALDLLDRATETFEMLLSAKRAFKRALMNDLLTGRRRFPEFVRSSGTRWTRLGTIPTDWEISPLSTVTERLTRRNAANVPRVLTCSGEQGLIDQTEFFSKLVASDAREGYFLLHHGDFAYNRSTMKGYPFGAIKRLDKYEIGAVSTLNICFSLRPSTIDSDFVVHLFESGVLNRQLGRIARVGSRAHGLLNVTMDDFYAIGVPLPSPEEQQTISAVLNRLDDEIALLQDLHISNATLKRGLMQRLLSGEIELPELLPTAGAAAETTDDNS